MRFLLDIAVDTPGADLGAVAEPSFDPEPRRVDPLRAQRAFTDEVRQLCARLRALPSSEWDSCVVLGSRALDVHWIVHNALHEASHHLGDIERLRQIGVTSPPPS